MRSVNSPPLNEHFLTEETIMLVLSRKTGQSIVISGRITLTVNRIAGNRVALAFDAPRDVHIRRSELPVFDDGIDEVEDHIAAIQTGNARNVVVDVAFDHRVSHRER